MSPLSTEQLHSLSEVEKQIAEMVDRVQSEDRLKRFCECRYPLVDHVSQFNGTCAECGKLVQHIRRVRDECEGLR